jgi:hypothetical protein
LLSQLALDFRHDAAKACKNLRNCQPEHEGEAGERQCPNKREDSVVSATRRMIPTIKTFVYRRNKQNRERNEQPEPSDFGDTLRNHAI